MHATVDLVGLLPAGAVGPVSLQYQIFRDGVPLTTLQQALKATLPAPSTAPIQGTYTIQLSAFDPLVAGDRRHRYELVLLNASTDATISLAIDWYAFVVQLQALDLPEPSLAEELASLVVSPTIFATESFPDVTLGQVAFQVPSITVPTPPQVSTDVLAKVPSVAVVRTDFAIQWSAPLLQLQYDLQRDGESLINGPQVLVNDNLGFTPTAPFVLQCSVAAYDRAVAPGAHVYTLTVQSFDTTPGPTDINALNFSQQVAVFTA